MGMAFLLLRVGFVSFSLSCILIDMCFCLAFSSSYWFSLSFKGVSFTVCIGNWYSNGLVSYYCSLFFCCKIHFKENILASLQEDYHYIGLVIYSHLIQKPLNLEASTSWPEGEKKTRNYYTTSLS